MSEEKLELNTIRLHRHLEKQGNLDPAEEWSMPRISTPLFRPKGMPRSTFNEQTIKEAAKVGEGVGEVYEEPPYAASGHVDLEESSMPDFYDDN